MSGRLAGKTALITAAGQGMGRAVALAMAREGAQVTATDVNEQMLAGLAGTPGIRTQRLDVLDDAAVEATIKGLPPLDVLFNCAGYVHHGSIVDCAPKDWEFSMSLNVRSMYVACRAAIPAMVRRYEAEGKWSSIVNMASICGSIKGLPNRFVYGTSKAAVVGLTKAIAADFVQKGVRCNAIAPGTVDTPSLADRINAFPDPVEARKAFVARQPMGRIGRADEIAALAVYLASDESGYTTGTVQVIDGGWSN